MNKQELIDKAVHTLSSKMPPEPHPDSKLSDFDGLYYIYEDEIRIKLMNGSQAYNDLICGISDYKKRARELGYVNGYRWGVEYPTNGKKPDLPSDTVIMWLDDVLSGETKCGDLNWYGVLSFKITDQRYKPADTSYLDNESSSLDNSDEWYDYDNQKAIALPPLSTPLQWSTNGGRDWHTTSLKYSDHVVFLTSGYQLYKWEDSNVKFRPLDHNRKAEAEKDALIKEATEILYKHACATKGELIDGAKALYEAGYLKLPAE